MNKKTKPSKEAWQAPRGMHDLIGPAYYAVQGFKEKAAEIAMYYGYKPIETPMLEHAEIYTAGIGEGTDIVEKEMYTLRTRSGDHLALRPEGTAGVMRAYLEHGMHTQPQPVLFYYDGPFFRHDKPQAGRTRQFQSFGVECIGTEKSIADTMTIRIIMTILEETGIKDKALEINSIGDKNCRHLYRKALVAYYRKHVGDLCADCKRRLKKNPLRLLDCKDATCVALREHAPDSISTLCEACKQHFKEVLESLETMGIEYQMKNSLVRGLDYYTRTVFEVSIPKPIKPDELAETGRYAVAGGGRYDYLARTLGSKRDVPAVGAGIGIDRIIASPEYANLAPRLVKKPKVFFVQLGFEAKLKSLAVIEILRKARVPIAQALPKDSLATQLAMAERSGTPYAIILGQKEVIDETVIVRTMDTRSQDTVKVAALAEYVKTHLKS